jgi:hypothetical protein
MRHERCAMRPHEQAPEVWKVELSVDHASTFDIYDEGREHDGTMPNERDLAVSQLCGLVKRMAHSS